MTAPAIHVAHAIALRGGRHARARAFVLEQFDGRPVRHSFTVAIDDNPADASAAAVRYVREMYARDGLDAPADVVDHGRKAAALVDSNLFGGVA